MLLERTRYLRPRLRSKGLSLEIRCKANALPLKSLLFATAYVNKYSLKQKYSNASLYSSRLNSQVSRISSIINALNLHAKNTKSQYVHAPQHPNPDNSGIASNPDDPDMHSKSMEFMINSYVELFYNVGKDERKGYIESFNRSRHTKIKPERNLLVLPALMAELKMPKKEVSSAIFRSLYKMPFKVLHDSSKSALHVALFEQNIAIRTIPYGTVESFSQSMQMLEGKIKDIESGVIKPQEDEDSKANFIDEATRFSNDTEINIIDIISEKVGTENAILTRLHRMMRRASTNY